jgi:uncharacterized membrane protein YphA (DoxX/SURF4 family)
MKVACDTTPMGPGRGALGLLTRLVLGGLFVFSGYLKLGMPSFGFLPTMQPRDFYFAINKFEMGLSQPVMEVMTYSIAWTELLCGLALVLGLWARGAALVIAGLMVAFVVGIISLMARGIEVKCTCFGALGVICPADAPMGWCHLGRNAVFFALAVIVLAAGPGWLALDRLKRCGR